MNTEKTFIKKFFKDRTEAQKTKVQDITVNKKKLN